MARFIITNNEDTANLFPPISPEDAGDVLEIETDLDFSYPVPSVYTYIALLSSKTEVTSAGIRAALEKWNEDEGNQHPDVKALRYQLLVTSDIKNVGVNRSRLDIANLRLVINKKDDTTSTVVPVVSYNSGPSSMDSAKLPADLMAGYGVDGRIDYHLNHTPVISASRTVDEDFGGVILIQFSQAVDAVEFYEFMKQDIASETEPKVCVYDVRTNNEMVFAGYMKDDTEEEFESLAEYGSITLAGYCGLELWNE